MPKRVDLGNGYFAEFPDDMSNDNISAALRRQFGGKEAAPAVPAVAKHSAPVQAAIDTGDQALAALQGAGRAAFNIPGVVTSAIDKVAGTKLNDTYEADRAARAARNPTESTLGTVAGSLAGGGVVAKGLSLIPKVGAAIAPVAGQTGRNILRLAGVGAAGGGVQAASTGEDIPTGAALGAVAAPAAAGVVKGVAKVAQATLGTRSEAAIRVLASRLKESPAELKTAISDFVTKTGRQPTLLELTGEKSGAELRVLAEAKEPVGDAFRTAQDDTSNARPGSMARQIKAGGPTDTSANLDKVRKDAFDAAMGPIASKPVVVPPNAPPALRRMLANDVRLRAANGDPGVAAAYERGEVDLRTIDNVRQDLGRLAEREPGRGYAQLRAYTTNLGTRTEPTYGHALDEYASFSRNKAGFDNGVSGKLPSELSGPDRIDATKPDYAAGRNVGVRTALASDAASSPKNAVKLAGDLAQPSTLGGRVGAGLKQAPALSIPEAQRLQRLGQAETQSNERLRQVNTPVKAESEQSHAAFQALAEGAVAAGGHAMTGFRLHAARRLMLFVADRTITTKTAQRAAEYLTDPAKVKAGVNLLRRAGMSEAKIANLAQQFAAGAGVAAGGAQ